MDGKIRQRSDANARHCMMSSFKKDDCGSIVVPPENRLTLMMDANFQQKFCISLEGGFVVLRNMLIPNAVSLTFGTP